MSCFLRFFKILVITFFFSSNILFSKDKTTYTISVENISYKPYFYTDSSKNYKGFSRDLFDLFAKKNNIRIEFQTMPVARILKDFFNGDIDIKFPDVAKWQKEKRVNKKIFYSENVVEFIDGVIVKVENKNKDLSFLKTIGTIRGFETSIYKKKGIRIIESSNIPELIDKLNNNMVDGVFFNVSVAIHYINSNKKYKNKLIFKKDFPYYRDYYKLSSMKNKDFINKFNVFLRTNSKEINALKLKNGIVF